MKELSQYIITSFRNRFQFPFFMKSTSLSNLIVALLLVINAGDISGQVFSQTSIGDGGSNPSGVDFAQLRKDIIAHSPEAAEIARYDALPVTLYTGMPNISVPIYELKTPNLDLPFALSYNYNGYKPNETASWVGMGWSIQGAGVIMRIVKGQVDGTMAAGNNYDNYMKMSQLSWSQPFLKKVGINEVDPEPDLYIFHVGSYSGKFIMLNGHAYLFPYQNLVIGRDGNGFKMTDEKGNCYFFYAVETTYQKQQAGSAYVGPHSSAWFVSQIVSANRMDTIHFQYNIYTYKQPTSFMDVYTIDNHLSGGMNTSGHSYQEVYFEGDHITSLLLTCKFSLT